MTKNHLDLRHDAAMLAWAISRELKNISPSDFIGGNITGLGKANAAANDA